MTDIVLFRDGDRTHGIPRDCYVHLCGVDDARLLEWSTHVQTPKYEHYVKNKFKVLNDEVELWLATTDICERVQLKYLQNDVHMIFQDPVECALFKMAFNIS